MTTQKKGKKRIFYVRKASTNPWLSGGAPVGYDKHVRTVELKSTENKWLVWEVNSWLRLNVFLFSIAGLVTVYWP